MVDIAIFVEMLQWSNWIPTQAFFRQILELLLRCDVGGNIVVGIVAAQWRRSARAWSARDGSPNMSAQRRSRVSALVTEKGCVYIDKDLVVTHDDDVSDKQRVLSNG